MAKTTITQINDDIDGSRDAMEVSFSFDGVDYVIDLGKKNQAAMTKAMQPYVDAATRVNRRQSARKSNTPKRDLASIREWAKGQGIEVSERGRVAATVIEQYDAAN